MDPVNTLPLPSLLESYSYDSPLPDYPAESSKAAEKVQTELECAGDKSGDQAEDEEWMMGIDEAGRGPVLGPMVYGAAYCPMPFKETLETIGFDDSKALTPETRDRLWAAFDDYEPLCYSTRVISPQDISKDMLKRVPFNLNRQAEEATISLIRSALGRGVRLKKVFVDALGPAKQWQDRLSEMFPTMEFTVQAKADSTFKIVGAASIAAKVTRDKLVDFWTHPEGSQLPLCCLKPSGIPIRQSSSGGKKRKAGKAAVSNKPSMKKQKLESLDNLSDQHADSTSQTIAESHETDLETEDRPAENAVAPDADGIVEIEERGSGYPGDPKTIAYLKAAFHPVFGYPSIVRFSWSGVKVSLENQAKSCKWIDEDESKTRSVRGMFKQTSSLASVVSKSDKAFTGGLEAGICSDLGLTSVGQM